LEAEAMTTLTQEFRLIDARHEVDRMKTAHIEILRTLLREARGRRLTLKDKWRLWDLARQHPHLANLYDINPPSQTV
jgi:hypothetical protein